MSTKRYETIKKTRLPQHTEQQGDTAFFKKTITMKNKTRQNKTMLNETISIVVIDYLTTKVRK